MHNPSFAATNLRCVRQSSLIFDALSFHLTAGELLLVEGANGSGKTSLLRILAGLNAPHAGHIAWEGGTQNLHYLGHKNGIKHGLTVRENLQLFAKLHQLANKMIEKTLTYFQLTAHSEHLTAALSAGQKRRVALAKLMLIQKPLWILDEPFTALDAENTHLFSDLIDSHLQAGGIAIVSTHQALKLASIRIQRMVLAP